jgi:hypothetical protein
LGDVGAEAPTIHPAKNAGWRRVRKRREGWGTLKFIWFVALERVHRQECLCHIHAGPLESGRYRWRWRKHS